ncbi:MAG TPA: transporter substrate-binding domain-containing protein [Candidatus Limnocylindrales bacterium]|nr:transporter substrate-binding domain-containing protein [Candidatus Limnocylindrales bacterium]
MISVQRRLAGLFAVAALVATACGGAGASTAPTAAPTTASAATSAPSVAASAAAATPITGGLLDKVLKAGVLVVSTDPDYAPQSFLQPDGTFVGFDIDVAKEIAKRLGVQVKFVTPGWDVITAGSWAGRWDVSVGSMTITVPRQQVLDFTDPYYYTPAQMAATKKSGITTLAGLAGKVICVGKATTYDDWVQGKLQSVSLGPVATPPTGATVKELATDQNCAEAITAGQNVGDGFLSSDTVIESAIQNGTPIVTVGTPVFTEQLAASVDKSGPDPTDFVAAVSKIIDDMHADGTLKAFSMTWFKADLTTPPSGG